MPFNPAIEHHFAALPDPRIERSKRHNLLDVLVIALCAAICGADDFVGIEAWGKAKEGWLKGRLELKGGIPSHDTFGRLFARLDPEAFSGCLAAWTRAMKARTGSDGVAVSEGKSSPWMANYCGAPSTLRAAKGPSIWFLPGPARAAWCSNRRR